MYKKSSSKKVYLAIILIILLVVGIAALVYAIDASKGGTANATVGIHVGDTFTYKLSGSSQLGSPDAKTPDYLIVYNNTDTYTITVTGINGTQISLNTVWRLLNGTQFTSPQIIDIADGNKTDQNGFWAIYPSNLKIGDLLSPKGFDGIKVNATDTKTYANSIRTRCFFQVESQFRDMTDPTGNTMRDEYDGVYFDQQTGMLDTLTNIQSYNNPQYNILITWQLVNTNVWTVQ